MKQCNLALYPKEADVFLWGLVWADPDSPTMLDDVPRQSRRVQACAQTKYGGKLVVRRIHFPLFYYLPLGND